MKIFSGTKYSRLAEQICLNFTNFTLGNLKIDKFSDGEILPCFLESIRDIDVFFINSSDCSDSIMETLLVVDAAKRSGCKSFTLVSPYSGYSRQDKSDHLRSSIGSKLLADILEKAGVNRLITIIKEVNPNYNFPKSLASSIIEGALHQQFLKKHFKIILQFITNMMFKIVILQKL
jgi:ribose-phosphate pyrophosphokinase